MSSDETTAAQPRWRRAKFGGGIECVLRAKWLGSVEPVIDGVCRYYTPQGIGSASSEAEAKRTVEDLARG